MESKNLKANLKIDVTTVATVREEKKAAVKEMKSVVFLRNKTGTKGATLNREAKTTLAQSKRQSARAQQIQKASALPFIF